MVPSSLFLLSRWLKAALIVVLSVHPIAQLLGQLNSEGFSPVHPSPNQPTQFCHPSKFFDGSAPIRAEIFFTKVGDKSGMANIPVVVQTDAHFENGMVCASFIAPADALGVSAVFRDDFGHVDDNGGKGYSTPLYKDDRVLPGSYGSIADLMTDVSPFVNVKANKAYARSLFENEMKEHPSLKRSFFRNYIGTFDVYDAKEKEMFKNNLVQFTGYSDLSEWDLLDVRAYYGLIAETDSARKYEELILKRFPEGSWSLQTRSLKPAMEIDTTAGLEHKWKKYKAYIDTYNKSYPDPFTRRHMQSRTGQVLRSMLFLVAERDDLQTWEREVIKLDSFSRFRTYTIAAMRIEEKVKTSIQPTRRPMRPESALYQSTKEEERLLAYAESLARRSVDWHRAWLDAPRDPADPSHAVGESLRTWRALLLATALDALSQALVLQQRPAEALDVVREAVKQCGYSEAEINEHYIDLLVRNNRLDEARQETSRLVKMAKGTPAIHEFYKTMVADSSQSIARTNLEKKLRKEMIREAVPELSFQDANGKLVSMNNFKGKTVVVDFWATWCAPCMVGLEAMSEVVERYKVRKDIVFLFVNTEKVTDETKRHVSRELESLGYSLDVYYDPERNGSKGMNVFVLPTLVMVDARGEIRFRHTGLVLTAGKQQHMDEFAAMIELTAKK